MLNLGHSAKLQHYNSRTPEVSAVTSLLPASPLHPPLVHSKSPTGHHHHHASQPHHSIRVFDSKPPPSLFLLGSTHRAAGGRRGGGSGRRRCTQSCRGPPKALRFSPPLSFFSSGCPPGFLNRSCDFRSLCFHFFSFFVFEFDLNFPEFGSIPCNDFWGIGSC